MNTLFGIITGIWTNSTQWSQTVTLEVLDMLTQSTSCVTFKLLWGHLLSPPYIYMYSYSKCLTVWIHILFKKKKNQTAMGRLVRQEQQTNVRRTFMSFSCSTSNCCCFCFYWDFFWASWVSCPKALGPEHHPPSNWWRTPVMCCSKQRKTALRQTLSA